jgi:hypothetical protein
MTRTVWSPSAVSVASMVSSNGGAPLPFRQDSSVSLVAVNLPEPAGQATGIGEC